MKYINNLKKEISILKTLNHRNIVKYYTTEITEHRDEVDIILEYVFVTGCLLRLEKKILENANKLMVYECINFVKSAY